MKLEGLKQTNQNVTCFPAKEFDREGRNGFFSFLSTRFDPFLVGELLLIWKKTSVSVVMFRPIVSIREVLFSFLPSFLSRMLPHFLLFSALFIVNCLSLECYIGYSVLKGEQNNLCWREKECLGSTIGSETKKCEKETDFCYNATLHLADFTTLQKAGCNSVVCQVCDEFIPIWSRFFSSIKTNVLIRQSGESQFSSAVAMTLTNAMEGALWWGFLLSFWLSEFSGLFCFQCSIVNTVYWLFSGQRIFHWSWFGYGAWHSFFYGKIIYIYKKKINGKAFLFVFPLKPCLPSSSPARPIHQSVVFRVSSSVFEIFFDHGSSSWYDPVHQRYS